MRIGILQNIQPLCLRREVINFAETHPIVNEHYWQKTVASFPSYSTVELIIIPHRGEARLSIYVELVEGNGSCFSPLRLRIRDDAIYFATRKTLFFCCTRGGKSFRSERLQRLFSSAAILRFKPTAGRWNTFSC